MQVTCCFNSIWHEPKNYLVTIRIRTIAKLVEFLTLSRELDSPDSLASSAILKLDG